jgi:hypothetical protein
MNTHSKSNVLRSLRVLFDRRVQEASFFKYCDTYFEVFRFARRLNDTDIEACADAFRDLCNVRRASGE